MRRFELLEPTTLHEACAAIANGDDAKVVAGGTALLTLIKQGLFIPKTLVNLKKISTGSEISYDPRMGLRIGALASIFDIEKSPLVRQHYPVLAQACHLVANIRIRNMASIGGNLAHGDYQTDPPTVLVALDASVELLSCYGTRRMKLSEFLHGSYETALEPGELVSALLVPPPRDWRGTYLKFTNGSSEERPCAGVAVLVHLKSGKCQELRLVVGAVSPKPVRVLQAEEMARGRSLDSRLIEQTAVAARHAVAPINDLRGPADYKRHVVGVLVRRALSAAARG